MTQTMRWALFAVSLLACAAVGYGAYTLAGFSWDQVVSYESPYAGRALPAATAGAEEASRTVLVIVDGLRADASRTMGTLNALREHGSDLTLTAPQPSLSYPNWTTLLTGARQDVSGVVTNWHEGAAPVESLFDTAARQGAKTVFVGPTDFQTLYGVRDKSVATYMKDWSEEYLTGEYVDEAIRLGRQEDPRLLVLHLPDVDEAGHSFGGTSKQYAETVAKIDADLGRLVNGLQDGRTVFVVTADHGHIDTGGHGGWEPEAVQVPAVIAGPGIKLSQGAGKSEDVAPTVAVLAGIGVPRFATGVPLSEVVRRADPAALASARSQREAFEAAYVAVVSAEGSSTAGVGTASPSGEALSVSEVEQARAAVDRSERLPVAALGLLAALLVLVAIGVASRQAFLAALAGAAAYYVSYNLLFFAVHGYRWSLSAFNSEDKIDAWMNGRLIEAAVATLIAAAVAAWVYPLLRSEPKGPRGEFLPGWLTLGPATALVTLATLGLQVAWFVWWWGLDPIWRLPDFKWAFKYDLDLIQATAIGFAAVLTPLVTYLIGRYHPRVRQTAAEE